VPQRLRKRARTDGEQEGRVVLVLAVLAAAGPFVVLGFGPLVRGEPAPLATWEKVLLVGVTPVLALMSLALFARSSVARARREGRAGAVLAGTTLLLAAASAFAIYARG